LSHSAFLNIICSLKSNEILNIICSLKSKKTAKINNIPAYFINVAREVLAPYLAYMFSLSFEFGIFSDTLKIATVMPIYKANDKYDVSNHCPISILPCLSKILENLIKKDC